MGRLFKVLAAGGLATLAAAAPVAAAVIRVPTDFVSVVNAVEAATDGDVIQIAGNGGSTYPVRDLRIAKDITLQGGWRIDFQTRSPAVYVSVLRDTTVIPDRPAVRVEGAARVKLDGLQIYGGRFGVLAEEGADIEMIDCAIRAQRHNQPSPGVDANIGTAIRMVGGTLRLERTHLDSARSGFRGAGLGLLDVSSVEIVDCVIENMVAAALFEETSGGGIYARDVAQLTITDTSFLNCATVQRGGGAYLLRTSLTAVRCEFRNGLGSTAGGGLYIQDCPSVLLEDCVFVQNQSTVGGALYAIDTPSLIVRTSPSAIDSTRFAEQQGFVEGAAVSLTRTGFSFEGCVFEHNYRATPPVQIAERGGSVIATESSGSVIGCTFREEKVEGKGGAWAQIGGEASFQGCRFTSCEAGIFGGALQIELGGRIEMTDCLIAESSARFGGGVAASFTGDIDLVHCTVVGGVGRSAGAAVYLDTGSTVRVRDSILCCATRGDQVYCGSGTLLVSYSDVWNQDSVNPRGEYGGLCPDLREQAENVWENPRLCPDDPDYRIASGSPCEGTASDGEDMGWQPVGCSPVATAVESTSWGRIKSLYRGR